MKYYLLPYALFFILFCGACAAADQSEWTSPTELALSAKINRELVRCFEPTKISHLDSGGNVVEIIVSGKGKVNIIDKRHEDIEVFIQKITDNPYEKMKTLLEKNPGSNHCGSLWKIYPISDKISRESASFIEDIRELKTPFALEEVIVLHEPAVHLTFRLSNISFSATWFGCDSAPIAKWTQSFLESIAGDTLSPCNSDRSDKER